MKLPFTKRNLLNIKQLPPPIGLIAFLLAAVLLQACEKEAVAPPYADTLNSYYVESTHLGVATSDSISAFTTKVNVLTAAWPEVMDEPLYPRIVENIRQNLIRFEITIDGEWDGIIEIKK